MGENVTYYVVLPFTRGDDGEFVPLEPIEAHTSDGAKRRATAVALDKGGAIAFSRTGDPGSGDFADAVVLGRYGEVPADLADISVE